jgi:hypothetical protein
MAGFHEMVERLAPSMVLAWRSPNQAGEYVLLEPTGASRCMRFGLINRRSSRSRARFGK